MRMIINVLIFLIGISLYASYGIPGFLYLAAATIISYGAGLLTQKQRWFSWVSIILNVLMLTMVKLQPFTGWSILAPMGISYFTLQIISYNVDVYRGKYPAERNLFRYAFYVTYIPHLFLGPIERYDAMEPVLRKRRITWDAVFAGCTRVLWGLFKKMIIATRIGVIVSTISGDTGAYSGAYALVAMLLYSIQLYNDFSGGIDIVLGVSRMLGISMSENFDTPYLSQSFQEFWRRWHITLGSWLRDYVYIPLGGNRKGKIRKVCNVIITFLVSGLWHGTQYILWGVANGVFVACGTRLQTRSKTLNRVGTFLLVSLLWSFFIWPNMFTAVKMMTSVFTTFNYGAFFATIGTLGLTLGDWIVLFVALLLLWGYDLHTERIRNFFSKLAPAGKLAVIGGLALVVMVFGMYGIGFNSEAFIYSKF